MRGHIATMYFPPPLIPPHQGGGRLDLAIPHVRSPRKNGDRGLNVIVQKVLEFVVRSLLDPRVKLGDDGGV
ncbi:MAG: hypothetical protein ACJAZW_002461 [Maritalea sp.]|jgi:hypothetical protein